MSYSQNTVEITTEELRIANMIFAEHELFSKEIPLLKQQIINLERNDSNWIITDSLRKNELLLLNKELETQYNNVRILDSRLNKQIKINKYTIAGSIAFILITCLILK